MVFCVQHTRRSAPYSTPLRMCQEVFQPQDTEKRDPLIQTLFYLWVPSCMLKTLLQVSNSISYNNNNRNNKTNVCRQDVLHHVQPLGQCSVISRNNYFSSRLRTRRRLLGTNTPHLWLNLLSCMQAKRSIPYSTPGTTRQALWRLSTLATTCSAQVLRTCQMERLWSSGAVLAAMARMLPAYFRAKAFMQALV